MSFSLFISHEICSSNRSMCPRCDDDDCAFWKLKDSCLYTKITRVFDNEMTLFFAFVMALWGEDLKHLTVFCNPTKSGKILIFKFLF